MRSSLRQGGLGAGGSSRESFNPMDGLANLADCMLVLACGLMLSLIVSWNLDIAIDQPLPEPEQNTVSPVEGLEDSPLTDIDESSGYQQMGVVYQDPQTGELYMVLNQ